MGAAWANSSSWKCYCFFIRYVLEDKQQQFVRRMTCFRFVRAYVQLAVKPAALTFLARYDDQLYMHLFHLRPASIHRAFQLIEAFHKGRVVLLAQLSEQISFSADGRAQQTSPFGVG